MEINLIAVLLAAIAKMVLGAVWYSPALFGKQWMRLAAITEATMQTAKKGMKKRYAGSFIVALVMSYVLAQIMEVTGQDSVKDGFQSAFWLWLGFIAPVTSSGVLWKNEPKALYMLDNGYNLASLIAMGAILGGWS